MKSMTGFGRGHSNRDGLSAVVEIASINRRQSEISLSLPRDIELIENRIRERINQRVARGRLTVRVSVELNEQVSAGSVHLNRTLAKAYASELQQLASELGLSTGLTLDCLAQLPGVVKTPSTGLDPDALWPLVESALKTALDALVRMRAREGAQLARDLSARISKMRKLGRRIAARAPKQAAHYRNALLHRIRAAGLDSVKAQDERILKEVVLFADRCDISEELARLQCHFQQFDDCRKSTEPVGRTLDFLAQEMNREINTIGSKANDPLISRAVVEFKAELERFREQVQNIE